MEPPLNSLYLQLIGFGVSLIACAVFSFLETSITALRLFKLKELAQRTGKYTQLFHVLEANPHRVLIGILIASSMADVTAAALVTHIMETFFAKLQLSGSLGFSLGIGVATIALLIFGEIIPKNVARVQGDRFFASTLWLTNIIFYGFHPLITFLMHLSDYCISWINKLVDHDGIKSTQAITSEQEIKFLIDHINEKGLMEREKTQMLRNIFELGSTAVREIMVPATDIVSIDARLSIQETIGVFSQHQFSRLPVFQDRPDNIIGMIYQKDIFSLWVRNEQRDLKETVRPILFIPESVKVNQLLREFKQQNMHIGMVINEFGGVTGLVTLEDVLEEIVGDISDEHEPPIEKVVPLQQGGWLVDAAITLEELGELLHIIFEAEAALTLGGFLTEQLQHLPKKGERILYKRYYFQVQKASPKRVFQVLIFEEKAPEIAEGGIHKGVLAE